MNKTQKIETSEYVDGVSPFRGSFQSHCSPFKMTAKLGPSILNCQDSDKKSSSQQTVIKNIKPSLEQLNQTIQLTKEFDLSESKLKGVDLEALSQLSHSLKTVEILRQSIIGKIQLNSKQNSVQSLSRKTSQTKFDLSDTQQTLKVKACEDYGDTINLPLQIKPRPQKQHSRDRSPITTIKVNAKEIYDSATVEKVQNKIKKDRTSHSKQNVSRVLGNLCKTSGIMDQILSGGNLKNQRNSSLQRNNFAYSSFQNEGNSVAKNLNSKTQLNSFGVQIRKFELNSSEKPSASQIQQDRKRRPISIEKLQIKSEKEKKSETLATYRSKDSQIRKPQFMERSNSRIIALNKKQNLKSQDKPVDQQRLNFQSKNKSQENIILQRKPAVPIQNKGVRFSVQSKISPQRTLQRSFSKVLEATKCLNRQESNASLTRVKKMVASRSFVGKPRNTQSQLHGISVSSHHFSIDHAQETQQEMFRKASEKALLKQRGLQKQLDQISGMSKSRTRDQEHSQEKSMPSYMRPLDRHRESALKKDNSQGRSLLKSFSNQRLQIEQKFQNLYRHDKSPQFSGSKRIQMKKPLGISAQVKLLKQQDFQNIHTQSIASSISTIKPENTQKIAPFHQSHKLKTTKQNFETMSKSTWNIQNTEQDSEYLPSQSQSLLSINHKAHKKSKPKIQLTNHFDQLVEQRILSPPSGGSGFSLGTQFTKRSGNFSFKNNLSNMPLSVNPNIGSKDQKKSLSKVRKSIIDLTKNDDESLGLNTQNTLAPTMQSSTPKANSNVIPPSFISNQQNQLKDQRYTRSSSALHLNLTDQLSGKILLNPEAQKSSRRNQGQPSTRGYMAQTYSSSQIPLQRSQSNCSFANLKFDNQPSQRNPYVQTSSRIQRRQQRNLDKLELLKKARELGNKYSEKIAEEVRQRSKKVQQKEFETLLVRTSNISSPEKGFQPEFYQTELEGTANIEINILDPEIKLDASVLPSQQESPEKAIQNQPQPAVNYQSAPVIISDSRFERKRRSSKEILRQKRLQLEKKEAQKQAQKQRFQRLQLSLRFLNMNLGAVVLGYKTRRIYFNSETIRKHRIEYRDLIQFAFMLQTEINQLKGKMNQSDNSEQILQDLDIAQETLRMTLVEMKSKRELFQEDFAKLNNSENSQWMNESLPREVQDILYEQASKFEEARNSYQTRKQNKLDKIRKEQDMQYYNEFSQNEDLDNVMHQELQLEASELERRYRPQPISQSPKKKHVIANKQELSLITEQFSPEMRQDSVSQHDMKNVSYSSPQHNRQTIQSKLKHSIISQSSKQRASKFESKIPRIDSSNKKSHCSRSNRSRSNIKSRIPAINVSKAQQSQIESLQDNDNFNVCQKFNCDIDQEKFNFAATFNGQADMKNEEAAGLRNDLNNNLEMSLLKLEASNSFLEGKDCDISRIEQLQSNMDLISPNNAQNYNLSRQVNEVEDGNSFKLSPCKMAQNETQSPYKIAQNETQTQYIFTSFDEKFNRQAVSQFVTKSPKKKAQSKAPSPFKKSPLKKDQNNTQKIAVKNESPEKENSIFFTQTSQISIKTGRRSRGERGSSKIQAFNSSGNQTNRISNPRLRPIDTQNVSSFQVNGQQKQATKRALITSNFVKKEVPLGFEGVTPKNVNKKTTVFSERFDLSSPEKSKSPFKKSLKTSPCKDLANSTQTLTQIQEMLMQLQQKKGEKVESNEKENFKKLLGNLQMQFESLIEK